MTFGPRPHGSRAEPGPRRDVCEQQGRIFCRPTKKGVPPTRLRGRVEWTYAFVVRTHLIGRRASAVPGWLAAALSGSHPFLRE